MKVKRAESGFGFFRSPTPIYDNGRCEPAQPYPFFLLPTSLSLLALLISFSLGFVLWVLSLSSTLFLLTRLPYSPDSLPSQGCTQKSDMFTFNFTFHVPNPFSISTLTSVANAATDAFNSVATDIREDPELLNYMVAGMGPEGVAGGFGYDSNRLVKRPPPSPFTSSSSSTSPKSKGSQNRHTVGLGLANPHAQDRNRHLPGRERNRADFQGSTSGFVNLNPPPGSGTPRFPATQAYSQSGSYSNLNAHRLGQGMRNQLYCNPLPASRKRGWVPALSEPTSCPSTDEDFATGSFGTPKHCDVNDMEGIASSSDFGHDTRRMSGMGSGVGDRRKWDEDGEESENAMEAGESQSLHSFYLCTPSSFCFVPFSRPEAA